jgi:hypothetical protein
MAIKYEIENIEEMRRREGIEDVELKEDIRALAIGDLVKLTFLTTTPPTTAETVQVRLTSIHGRTFEGALVHRPTASGLAKLRVGTPVSFTADQIHSIPNKYPSGRQRS